MNFPGRLTVTESVYYERQGRDPLQRENSFSRKLTSGEQLYHREMNATKEKESVDTGWVTKPSLILLHNIEGSFPQKLPTEEEKKALSDKVLLVSFKGSSFQATVNPGESFKLFSEDFSDVAISSKSDSVEYLLTVFPE
jgi:hypothetical protein